MILHRRIHKFASGKFDDGVALAQEFNRVARDRLGCGSKMYVASMWGGSLPRPRLVVDTEHESLAELEQYYARFFALAEVQALVPRWAAVVEDTWTENYVLVTP